METFEKLLRGHGYVLMYYLLELCTNWITRLLMMVVKTKRRRIMEHHHELLNLSHSSTTYIILLRVKW